MAKTRTKFVCQNCAGEQGSWYGRCPDCDAWNTLEEAAVAPEVLTAKAGKALLASRRGRPVPMAELTRQWLA